MSTDTHKPDWELKAECHGLGNWHAVISDGRKWWRLPGYLTKSQALAAGSEAIQRWTSTEETTCQEK